MKFSFKIYTALLILFSVLLIQKTHATHMVGGEISYRCLGSNNYAVTFSLFQNCRADGIEAIYADYPLQYAIYAKSASGTYSFYTSGSLPPSDTSNIPLNVSSDCVMNIPDVCLKKSVFNLNITLPPTAEEYVFVYQRCCRNPGIKTLINSGDLGVTYSASIPILTSGCNNSPEFRNDPPQLICVNIPFLYDYSATDTDGDSLVYRLCPTLRGASPTPGGAIPAGPAITGPPFMDANYAFGYTADNPIDAFPTATIDPATGVLTFTPTSSGRYQIKVCIDEYRNGQLINTHSRDLQMIATDCEKVNYADIPVKADFPNTYLVVCDGYTVSFENHSVGEVRNVEWDFGDGSPRRSEYAPTHTYSDTGTYEVKLIINKGLDCPDSIMRYVRVYPYLTGDFEHEGIYCTDETITFTDSVFNSRIELPYTVTYDFGDGTTYEGRNPTHTYTRGGTYAVTMTISNELGCGTQIVQQIEVIDFVPFAGRDTIVVKEYDMFLEASGGDSYEWFPKDNLSDPYNYRTQVSFPDTGVYEYVVFVESDKGCSGFDTVSVTVVGNRSLFLPNAFSPNGDGLNDVIFPTLIGYRSIDYFRIYNRYGQLVFVSYHGGVGWDGTVNGQPADIGVYYYEISARNYWNESEYFTGDITLLR